MADFYTKEEINSFIEDPKKYHNITDSGKEVKLCIGMNNIYNNSEDDLGDPSDCWYYGLINIVNIYMGKSKLDNIINAYNSNYKKPDGKSNSKILNGEELKNIYNKPSIYHSGTVNAIELTQSLRLEYGKSKTTEESSKEALKFVSTVYRRGPENCINNRDKKFLNLKRVNKAMGLAFNKQFIEFSNIKNFSYGGKMSEEEFMASLFLYYNSSSSKVDYKELYKIVVKENSTYESLENIKKLYKEYYGLPLLNVDYSVEEYEKSSLTNADTLLSELTKLMFDVSDPESSKKVAGYFVDNKYHISKSIESNFDSIYNNNPKLKTLLSYNYGDVPTWREESDPGNAPYKGDTEETQTEEEPTTEETQTEEEPTTEETTNKNSVEEKKDPATVPDVIIEEENENIQTVSFDPSDGSDVLENNFISVDRYWNFRNNVTPKVIIEFKVRKKIYDEKTKKEVYKYDWWNINDLAGSGQSDNNYFVSMNIEDNGAKRLELVLFDKNFTDIQDILAEAINSVQDSNNNDNVSETIDIKIQGSDQSWMGKIQEETSFANLRIRFGYSDKNVGVENHNYSGFGLAIKGDTSTTPYYRWRELERNASHYTKEKGEIKTINGVDVADDTNIMERFQQSTIMSTSNEFFINGLSTSLTETGVRYTIQGISMESFKLNGYKMMQRYSVLKGKPASLMAGFKTNFSSMVNIDDKEVKDNLNGSDIFYDYESGKYILVDENKVKEGIERALGPVPFMKKYVGDLVNLKACVVSNPTNTINSYIGGIDNQYSLVKDAEYLLEAEGEKTDIVLETSTPIGMMAKTINIILGDSTNEYPSHSYPTLRLGNTGTNLKNLAFMANAVKIISLYGDSYRGFCDLQGLSYDEEVTITYRNFLILQLAILGVGTYNMVSEAGSQFSIDLKQRTKSEGIVKTKFDSLNTLFEVNEELPLRWLIHRKPEEEETILDFPREEDLAEPAALGENTNFWISGKDYVYTSWWGSVGELKKANTEDITKQKFKGIKNSTKEYSVYYYPGAGFYDGYIKINDGEYIKYDYNGDSAAFSYGTMESCLNKRNEYDDYIKFPNEADDDWRDIAKGAIEQEDWAVMSSEMVAYSIARGYFGRLSGDGIFPKLINKLNASEDSGLKEIARAMNDCNKTFSESAKEYLNIVTREYIGTSKYPDPIYGTGEKIMRAFINAIAWVQGLFSSTAKQSIGVLGERRDIFKIAYNECVAEASDDEKGLTIKTAKNLFGNKEPAIKNNFIHMKELGEDDGKFLLDECHQTVGVDGIYFQNIDIYNSSDYSDWKFSMKEAVKTKADSFFTYTTTDGVTKQYYSIEITFDPTANKDDTPRGVNFKKPSEFSMEAAFDDFMVFRFYARYKKTAADKYSNNKTKYWFMIVNLKKEQYNQLISRYGTDLYTPVYIYLNAAALATFVTKNSEKKIYGRFLQFFDKPVINADNKAIFETVPEGSRLVRGRKSDINQKIGIMNTQYKAVLRTFKKVFIKTVNIIQKEVKEVKKELNVNYSELVKEISNGDALENLIKKELSYLNENKSKFEEKARPAEYVIDEDKEPFSKYDVYQGYLIENVYKKLTEMSPTDQTSTYKRKQKGEKKADGTPLDPVDTEAVSSVFYYIDLKIEDLQKRIAEREKQAERWRSANVGKEIEISLGNQYSRDTDSEEKVDPKSEKIKWKSLASIFNEYCAKCPPLIDAAELAATGLNEKSGENGVIPMVDENGEEITVKAVENFPRYSLTWGIDGEAKSGGVANIKFYYKKPQVPKRIRVYEWGVGNPKQHCIKSLNISSGNEFAMMHKSAFASVDSNNATFISQHYQGNGVEAEVQEIQTVFNEPSLVSGVINGEAARSSLLNMRNTIAKGTITLLGDPSLKFYGNFQPFTYPVYVNIILPNRNEVSTFGDTLNKKSSTFQYQLSGYYIISKISHNISSSGFTTTLEVMRYPGSDSGVETHVPKTNHGSDKSGKAFNPAGDLKMINV